MKETEKAKQWTNKGSVVTTPSESSPSNFSRTDGNDEFHGVPANVYGGSSSNQAAGSHSAQARDLGNNINYFGTLHFHSELL